MAKNEVESANEAAASQHAVIGVHSGVDEAEKNFCPTKHPEAQWFADAGLGLFLHWGIASVHGNVDLSWGMMKNAPWRTGEWASGCITPNEYWALADRFDPGEYDPDPWIAAARDAGFRYAVLTTKHHDGYTLWPSEHANLGVHTHLNGRDLVAPFVAACRHHGLKVGLYFSPPDWHLLRRHMSFEYATMKSIGPGAENLPPGETSAPGFGLDHEPVEIRRASDDFQIGLSRAIRGQVEELLTRYGRIDLIWFDGKASIGSRPQPISIARIRELQPHIVINPRLHGVGDFQTPECRMPVTAPEGWWELCHTWNDGGWGYHAHESYQTAATVFDRYRQCRAMGGNLLINCAPRPDGTMPEVYYRRLEEFARLRSGPGGGMRKGRGCGHGVRSSG